MYQLLAEWETEAVEEDTEHLEVVFLLITNDIHHLVDRVVLEAQFGGTDILGHIYGCAVGTKKELLVESVLREVSPNRAIFAAVEIALGKTAFYFTFAHEISVAFVVDFVKTYAHLRICLVKTRIYPLVHLLPEGTHFRVVLLPFDEHGLCLFDEWCLFLSGLLVHALRHEFLDLSFVLYIKAHIVVANQVVTFLAAILRCLAIAELLPCEHRLADVNTTVVDDIHRLADVNTTVVDDIGFHYVPAVCLLNLSDRVAKQVIAHVTEVQRLVGVRRRVFYHHEWFFRR